MKIRIIQIGRVKGEAFANEIHGFAKRIFPFADLDLVEIKEVVPEKTFKDGEFVVALDENGKELDSKGFSEFLGKRKDVGDKVAFVIGGPFGLDEAVIKRANFVLSLSKMTFTHQMVRIFLLEQIFRGFCILSGREYHY